MKLPITDEFLWEIFNLSQKVNDVLHFFGLGSYKDAFVSPHFSLRRIYEKRKAKQRFNDFLHYLIRKGYIKVKSLDPNQGIIITKKGMEKVLKIALEKTEKKKRKDGKWVMVIFDIPERKKALRNLFRKNLQVLGFNFFQKSVWICSYDVLREVQTIVQKYNLEKNVRIFLIEEIEIKTNY